MSTTGSTRQAETGEGPGQATSYQVRAELERFLERDLLGPWDGPSEELPAGITPSERYLVGRLVPRVAPLEVVSAATDAENGDGIPDILDDPSLVDDAGLGDAEDDDEEDSQAAVRAGKLAACAIGMSFQVPDDVDTVLVKAEWGRYERRRSENQLTEMGNPRTVWVRRPGGGEVEIPVDKEGPVDAEGRKGKIPDPTQDRVVLKYLVRHREGRRIVELTLVNDLPEAVRSKDQNRLYQARLTVTALDGHRAIFLGHNDPEHLRRGHHIDAEKHLLELLNRNHRQFGSGRQCAVEPEVRPGEKRAHLVRTTSFPSAEVPLIEPADIGDMPGVILDMARLGSQELARDELDRALRPLVTGYRKWLAEQETRFTDDPEIALYEEVGHDALKRARELADRLDRAITLLYESGSAREAFRFANQAMALQRVRGELVRVRLDKPERKAGPLFRELDVPKNRSWRPFQLAFLLLCLPGLTDPSHEDAHRGVEDGQVQLLFFPTGGGKTEAYLGLTAFTFAIRRLQGVVGTGVEARDGTDGVSVLMRYTLRLLTAQQFQRAAALVCACETLRKERIAGGDHRWGETPFRIGLWVGSSVTPNSYDEAKRQVDEQRNPDGDIGGALQLVACPWCGTRLTPTCLTTSEARRRVLLTCPDPNGECQFTARRSQGEGLPVLTVDEEVYRLTPALVISTVDKFAALPWRAATASLFGLVDETCPRHGWKNPEFDAFCRSSHPAVPAQGLARTEAQPATRLRPPDLIIQDELHLISDALGSMVGLYETVIDRLASRTLDGRTIRPVVVASTATVKRAADQVEQVFARGLAVFPPQVIDTGETFFSRVAPESPDTPGRRYRGIMAPGERLKSVEIRVAAAILEHTQYLYDRYGDTADPYMTLVDYFTATRELAGMKRLVDDDIADRLRSSKVRTRRRRPEISELTSRMPSSRIASTLAQLDVRFSTAYDTTQAIERLAALRKQDPDAAKAAWAARGKRPVDVILATSMMQVGVDVPRLGLMAVTGQPKNTAEYIQATSRVGRDRTRPGLVLTIYHWSRPRDLAHYETFAYEHATFGMRVEGLTTTPFSERALDRGLTGVVVAAMRHSSTVNLGNTAAHTVALDGQVARDLLDAVQARAERVTRDTRAADHARRETQHRLDRWAARRRRLQATTLGYQTDAGIDGLLHEPDSGPWDLWSAPRSLREVEPQVVLQLAAVDRSLDEAPAWAYSTGGTP